MPGGQAKTPGSAGIFQVDASEVLDRLKAEVRPAAPVPAEVVQASSRAPARDEAERLWTVTVDRPVKRGPGARRALLRPAKLVLRKLMRWYVAPFAAQQRSFNAAVLRLADELSERADQLGLRLGEERARTEARDDQLRADLGTLRSALEDEAAEPPAKLAEARRLVRELEERLLRLERRPRGAETATPITAQPQAAALPDYFGFEARMRGDADEIKRRQRVYVDDLLGAAPVLDLGCGRGELLSLLREAGIEARGVDADADMVAFARGEGLEVEHEDALVALEAVDDGSLGAVFASQLLEHLPPALLVRLLELAAAKVRPGGLLIAETINPLSPLALRNYFADLTHAQPLVPETLELLVRQAGFSSVEKRFLNEPERKLAVPDDPLLAANVARLNELLFAPLDYAVLARR